MRRRKLYSLIIILMISFLSFGQTDKSELITFKDEGFIKSLQNIIKPKNNCEISSNNHNWYIERKSNDSFIVSISRVSNLLQDLEKKNIYTTIINNQVVFYITQNENHIFLKMKYFIDLSKYADYEYVLFEDFSSWLITKDEKNDFIVKDKRIFKCNH